MFGIFSIFLFVVELATSLMITWVVFGRATVRQNQLDALKEVTRLGVVSAQRLLVIRAIDDEASLVLALATRRPVVCEISEQPAGAGISSCAARNVSSAGQTTRSLN